MVKLSGAISQLSNAKVLVVGDFLLDSYTIGKTRRISPEAPVAVLEVEREEHLPGGAGNVVLNVLSLGATVVPLGRIGLDKAGDLLVQIFKNEGIATESLVYQSGYPTPIKNRVIAENQQIVRIDHEKIQALPELLEQEIIDSLPSLLEDVKVIAISDYGKGFLSPTLLSAILKQAKKKTIPVITDPKGSDFSKYAHSTILKPNLKEAYAAADLPLDASLEEVAKRVLQSTHAEVLMITRSEKGISLFYPNGERDDFPVAVREVKDVTGAGDTVLAVLSCALASGISLSEAVQLSNIAAGIAIERVGCARISLGDLARRLLEMDVQNKVFDEDHLFALREVLRHTPFALVGLSEKTGLTTALFQALSQLSQRSQGNILLHVFDAEPDSGFIEMLASLRIVNFIILNKEGITKLCQSIYPKEIYLGSAEGLEKVDSAFNALVQPEVILFSSVQ
jgi:D-beta-D-heptose 7-phosphate kinase/D-beta-D-heptose 1-phosphate adenosyltransferase